MSFNSNSLFRICSSDLIRFFSLSDKESILLLISLFFSANLLSDFSISNFLEFNSFSALDKVFKAFSFASTNISVSGLGIKTSELTKKSLP